MSRELVILSIESVPGDPLRAAEQPNGDLLLPASARPVIEAALLAAEQALDPAQGDELAVIAQAKRLLGIEEIDAQAQALSRNLLKVQLI